MNRKGFYSQLIEEKIDCKVYGTTPESEFCLKCKKAKCNGECKELNNFKKEVKKAKCKT